MFDSLYRVGVVVLGVSSLSRGPSDWPNHDDVSWRVMVRVMVRRSHTTASSVQHASDSNFIYEALVSNVGIVALSCAREA